jgi:uncharacterized protein
MDAMTAPAAPAWLRLLRTPLLRMLLLGGGCVLLIILTEGVQAGFAGSPLLNIAATAAMAALGLGLYAAFVRRVEARPVSELATAPLGRELGLGLLLGAGLYTACVLVLMALGFYRVEGLNPWAFLLPAVAIALSSGVFEELLFRAVLFRIVEEWAGSWASLILSSLVFGFLHLINPGATLTGAVFISIEAGLLLAAAFMLTRRLWLGIGFHIAWNYTQSAVFSGIVSGNEAAPGLIRPSIAGPAWLTGGQFGLEASVVAFTLCTLTGVVLLLLAIRRGHIVPPAWRRG